MVDGLKRTDVRGDEGLAVGAMAVEGICSADAEQFLQGRRVKIMVPRNGDLIYAAARSQIYLEDNDNLTLICGLLQVTDLYVKVTEALIVVAEAAIAFVEKILVHTAFFKDRNDVFDAVLADGRTLDEHFYDGSPIGGETEVNFLAGRIVFFGDDLDLGFHAVLTLIVLEHAAECAIAGVVVNEHASSQVGIMAEFGNAHSRVAGDLNLADAGLLPRDRLEGNVDELIVWVRREGGSDSGS